MIATNRNYELDSMTDNFVCVCVFVCALSTIFYAEKQQLVCSSLQIQPWYQSLGYVQDIICGRNHLFPLSLPLCIYGFVKNSLNRGNL